MAHADPSPSTPLNLTPETIAAIAFAVRQADPDERDRKGRKVPEFSETSFDEWRSWRERFEGYVLMNRWSSPRAREELNVAIVGEARKRITTVRIIRPTAPGQPTPNYRLALNEIEAKLIPEVDSELTLANLDKCRQKPEEDIPTFHARMVYYWLRAHPMHDADVAETDRMLIRHFIKGLACHDTKKRTMDRRPATMTEALREAEHVHGTNVLLSDDIPKGVEAQGAPSVQEVGAPGKCLACDRTGHYVRDCRLLKAYKQKIGWKGGAASGRVAKHGSPGSKRAPSRRGRPLPKKRAFHQKRAEVAEVGEDMDGDDFVDPEGDTDEEAWASKAADSHDEEDADQGNA